MTPVALTPAVTDQVLAFFDPGLQPTDPKSCIPPPDAALFSSLDQIVWEMFTYQPGTSSTPVVESPFVADVPV
jgi:hypothetical protein